MGAAIRNEKISRVRHLSDQIILQKSSFRSDFPRTLKFGIPLRSVYELSDCSLCEPTDMLALRPTHSHRLYVAWQHTGAVVDRSG